VKKSSKSNSKAGAANPLTETVQTVSGMPTKLKIFKVASSRFWWVRVFLSGRYRMSTLKTEKLREAQEAAKKFFLQALLDTELGTGRATGKSLTRSFVSVGSKFIESQNVPDTPRRYNDDRIRFNKELLPYFAEKDVGDISNADIGALAKQMQQGGRSPATVNQYLIVLRKILKYAADNRLIASVPNFPKVKGKGGMTKRDYFELQEYEALVKTIEPLTGLTAGPRDYSTEIAGMIDTIKKGADPADGEIQYRKNGCAICHAIGGAGGKLGPDLSSIGASAPLDYIIESVLNPAAKVKEGYHGFSFKMKDGSQMVGIPARENATELFIRPGPGVELAILKANIVSRDNIGSIMPAGLADGITGVSRRNFYAFLGEIGKPGPFDASKGNVARLWVFDDQPPGALAKSATATPVYTLVNGQLTKEFNPGRLYATARFTAAAATTKPLVLTGVKAAWLDGKALDLKAGVFAGSIPAGNHSLTVEVDGNAPYFKAQCDDASFLGD
jgi:putative heme-binding domain-containing protein